MTWRAQTDDDDTGSGSYNAEVVTLEIRVSDPDPILAVIVSSLEAKDVRAAIVEEVTAHESATGHEVVITENGYQSDMGDAVCILHYVVDATATGLIGAAAWELARKVGRRLDGGVLSWSSRPTGGRTIKVSPLSEEHIRWSAKQLISHKFGLSEFPHIDKVATRNASATVWMTSTTAKFVAEIEFDGAVASLTNVECIRLYP